MNNNDQKQIENKRPKRNITYIFLIIIFVFFLALIGATLYFWIDFQNKYKINQGLIDNLKTDIENSFNEKNKIENSVRFQKYDNLSNDFRKTSKKILVLEKKISENEKNNEEILTLLLNLEKKFQALNLELISKLENDNRSKTIKIEKSNFPENKFDLSADLDKLKYQIQENIPWNKTLKAIHKSNNKTFLSTNSNELGILQKYSFLPPPSLKDLEYNFDTLIPSILKFLPHEDEGFINNQINLIVKSIKLRRTNITESESPYDLVMNIEYYLNKKNISIAIENFQKLPKEMQSPALDWFEHLQSRLAINSSIETILQNFKVSRK